MLPPEFRDVVLARCAEGKFMLTCYDGCLVGFPLPDWEEFEQLVLAIKNPFRKLRDFRRLVIGSAEQLVLDKQGRVHLSPSHREYARLDKDIELVGQSQKFEIWNPELYMAVLNQDFDDATACLGAGGIYIPL